MKTLSSAKKRFKVTATGKIKRKKTGKRHNLYQKPTRRKRELSNQTIVGPGQEATVKEMLVNYKA